MAGVPGPNASAAQVAAYWESEVKKHQIDTGRLLDYLHTLQVSGGAGLNDKQLQNRIDGIQEAINAAQKIANQQAAVLKTGSSSFGVSPKASPAARKNNAAAQLQQTTLKSEGQPTSPNSVFGQIYQSGSTNLNTTGMAALAAAVGSKYSFILNDKINPGKLKGLGALGAIVKSNVTIGSIIYSLMANQDQNTILAVQGELAKAGYLDPLHTTGLTPGEIGFSNDPTLQALATLLDSAQTRSLPVSQLLRQGQQSRQGQDWGKLWNSVVSGAPFSITGHTTDVQSPNSLADQLRQATTGAGSVSGGGQSVLGGGAGQNPTNQQTQQFISAAQAYEKNNPSVVTTQYEPQPGLGISGFTRFPLQKNQTTVGGVDQAAMDQFTYNWLIQNFGPNVAATGAANILSAFNQLLGLGDMGTGSAPSSAAGGG